MYTDPSGWTYRYVSEEDKNAWYQGAEFYNTINNLNNRYGGGGGGASGVGGPGQGGNGTGLNGVYYDWVSGTYRSVLTEQEVSGPVFCPTDFLAHYSGKAAENYVAAYQNLLRGSYTITLTDAGPGVKLDGWRGTPLAMPNSPNMLRSLPVQPNLRLPNSNFDPTLTNKFTTEIIPLSYVLSMESYHTKDLIRNNVYICEKQIVCKTKKY